MTFGALDDELLEIRLRALTAGQRTLFAASVAERLMPFFERYADAAPLQARYRRFRDLLDDVWRQPAGHDCADQVQRLQSAIPDDDEETLLAPFAQNAALAVIAAADSRVGTASGAVRAAISLYEAADFAANLAEPALDPNDHGYESKIAASSLIHEAWNAIEEDLACVHEEIDPGSLRWNARAQGNAWAATWPGSH